MGPQHPLISTDRSMKQKLSKEAKDLTQTTEQIDLIDIYRTLYLTGTEYAFFSVVPETFTRIYQMIDHKTSLTNFKKFKS